MLNLQKPTIDLFIYYSIAASKLVKWVKIAIKEMGG